LSSSSISQIFQRYPITNPYKQVTTKQLQAEVNDLKSQVRLLKTKVLSLKSKDLEIETKLVILESYNTNPPVLSTTDISGIHKTEIYKLFQKLLFKNSIR